MAARHLTGLQADSPVLLGEARHVFTHQVWLMRIWALRVTGGKPGAPWREADEQELSALALPAAMRCPAQEARRLMALPVQHQLNVKEQPGQAEFAPPEGR